MSRTGSNRIGKVSVSRVNLNVELEEQVKQDCQSGNEKLNFSNSPEVHRTNRVRNKGELAKSLLSLE